MKNPSRYIGVKGIEIKNASIYFKMRVSSKGFDLNASVFIT